MATMKIKAATDKHGLTRIKKGSPRRGFRVHPCKSVAEPGGVSRLSLCPCDGGCPRCTESPPLSGGVQDQITSLKDGGQPLPQPARNFFEPRFNRDFGHVRIHTGAGAAEAARSLNAKAFTVGRDVVFGAGRYDPGRPEGRRLLAHELTHTIQQRPGTVQCQRRQTTNPFINCNRNQRRTIERAIQPAENIVRAAYNSFFNTVTEEDSLRLRMLLSVHFGSNSKDVRTKVISVIRKMLDCLIGIKRRAIRFECVPPPTPNRHRNRNRNQNQNLHQLCGATDFGFLLTRQIGRKTLVYKDVIYICPNFFNKDTSEELRRYTLAHECTHMAGLTTPERVYLSDIFGRITEGDCLKRKMNPIQALHNADVYSFLVWCIARTGGRKGFVLRRIPQVVPWTEMNAKSIDRFFKGMNESVERKLKKLEKVLTKRMLKEYKRLKKNRKGGRSRRP